MTYRELAKLLDHTVKEIYGLPEDERASWVSYFFEALEAEMGISILEESRTALEERFSAGSW